MGKVLAINISSARGIDKTSIEQVKVIKGWGLEGDAHGGDWDRQVSILPVEAMEKVPPEKKEEVLKGGYTENFTILGIEPSGLIIGGLVKIGEAVIKILHIGKEEFKEHGRPYIISREGRFGRVVQGGLVNVGDVVSVQPYNKEAFLQYIEEGNFIMVQVFLDEGMDPNARDVYDATALMLAARNGHIEIVQALLRKDAKVNARSVDGVTALMAAAYGGHVEIAKMLISEGAELDLQSSGGLTALSAAIANNHDAVIQLLEKAGV